MAKDALVSDEIAKKFAAEKDSPYTRWVRAEGLDIINSFYVPNLHTVELKPWPRRGGRAVFLNHDASRTSNDCYVCEIPPGKELAPQHQLYEEMIYVLDGRGSTSVWNEAGERIDLDDSALIGGLGLCGRNPPIRATILPGGRLRASIPFRAVRMAYRCGDDQVCEKVEDGPLPPGDYTLRMRTPISDCRDEDGTTICNGRTAEGPACSAITTVARCHRTAQIADTATGGSG